MEAKEETVDTVAPALGEGLYTFPEAARILNSVTQAVSSRQLRYWLDTGLTPAYVDPEDDQPLLSFGDLISLEIVGRLRGQGASLQAIRHVEEVLRSEHHFVRPFAHQLFFTDGADVWAEVVGEEGRIVIELTGHRRHQHAWREAIATFTEEVTFGGPKGHADRWRLSPWVEVNPAVQFGTPVVIGTRVPVRTIVANLEVGTEKEVADWYGLTPEQVAGARDYLAAH